MTLNYHSPGIGSTPEFQSSGMPFTTSDNSDFAIDFEYVTRAVTVTAIGDIDATVDFGNTNDGVYTLPNGTPVRFEVKCKHVNIVVNSATVVSVCAELTGIKADSLIVIDQDELGTVS